MRTKGRVVKLYPKSSFSRHPKATDEVRGLVYIETGRMMGETVEFRGVFRKYPGLKNGTEIAGTLRKPPSFDKPVLLKTIRW